MPLTIDDDINVDNMREQAAKVKEELQQLRAEHFTLEIKALSNLVSVARACPPSLDVASQQLLERCNSCQTWYEQLKARTAKAEQKLKAEPAPILTETSSSMKSIAQIDMNQDKAN